MADDERPAAGLIRHLAVRDLRSLRDFQVELGPIAALLGEGHAGTSSILLALRAVLALDAEVLDAGDVRDGAEALSIAARTRAGALLTLDGRPPRLVDEPAHRRRPEVLWAPSRDRDGGAAALAFVTNLERRLVRGLRGTVVLIEEPELHLRPQAQRYLARLLRRIAANGNQVVYSTRSPAFLNVAQMDELIFVERRGPGGTTALRPPALKADDAFRVLSEFDAERAELFLARVVLLVEGETEKLALPFVFAALGADADREGVSIVECGGKANMVLFARVCASVGVPFVIVHDRDAYPGRHPSPAHRALHAEFRALAGPEHTVELAPDFEGVSRLRGSGHKPERAWRRFAQLDAGAMPSPLVRAVRLTLALAATADPLDRGRATDAGWADATDGGQVGRA